METATCANARRRVRVGVCVGTNVCVRTCVRVQMSARVIACLPLCLGFIWACTRGHSCAGVGASVCQRERVGAWLSV